MGFSLIKKPNIFKNIRLSMFFKESFGYNRVCSQNNLTHVLIKNTEKYVTK